MKKLSIITSFLSFAALCSCTVESDDCEPISDRMTITAHLSEQEPDTKTYMGPLEGSIYKVLWKEGDKLAIGKDGNFSQFELGSGENTKIGSFSGMRPLSIGPNRFFAASYPYSTASASNDATTITVGNVVPSYQTYVQDSFATDSYPMVSVSKDGIDYQMRNLAGIIQIPVLGSGTITGVYLVGNNGEPVCGEVKMKYSASTAEPLESEVEHEFGCDLEYGDETQTRLFMEAAEGIELNLTTQTVINLIVVPQEFEKGITVIFVDEDGGRFKVKGNLPLTVRRSWTLRMKPITYKKPEPLETANAYVVNEPGFNYFPAFCMGNRQECLLDADGRNLKADILWSDCGMDAVTNLEYFKTKDGRGNISFELKKDPATGKAVRGNVVVCLYDEDTKEIIWSWHLWLTETPKDVYTGGTCADGTYTTTTVDGTDVTFISEATVGHLAIMDRNLGAISANPADGWKTYGLYYQMGRKDPFIGGQSEGSPTDRSNLSVKNEIIGDENFRIVQKWEEEPFSDSFTKPTEWNLYLTNGWIMNFDWINLTRSIREPMTMASHNTIGNTLWTNYIEKDNCGYMDPELDNSSLNVYGHTGLQSTGHEAYWNRTKTIFDPCPAGYTVLGERNGDFFGKADTFTPSFTFPAYGVTSHFSYSGVDYDVWWPAAGMRSVNGTMIEVGYRGAYFHYDHINAEHGAHGTSFYVDGTNYKMDYRGDIITNHAASIRCVKAKQL